MSTKINLIVQLKETKALENFANSTSMDGNMSDMNADVSLGSLFNLDNTFGVVQIPSVTVADKKKDSGNTTNPMFESFADREGNAGDQTYIVRGAVYEADLEAFEKEMEKKKNVIQVFSDVMIEPQLVCPGSAPVGNHLLVEKLLCVPKMKSKGMDGTGVTIAIVDTGVNMAYLNSRGKTPNFNAAWSWRPASSGVALGSAPVGHGTMCGFDVCIAAPKCTLLDIALLTSNAGGPTPMSGLLSDAVKAYEHLIKYMSRPLRPGENASLVVNNSWGMFHKSWDYPVGHPGNFSHNPNHPFNLIVKKLALKGADIVFAAGNCGPECPDGRCQGVTNAGIYGANSSPFVTSVAGVATNLDRVGYSNSGPGNLTNKKPDITGYTHFAGSGVYSADGGTSAACPVVAGVIGAIRTRRPLNPASAITSPASIRNLIRSTANDLGAAGFDYLYGYGVINGCKITNKLFPISHLPVNLCETYPHICDLFIRDKPRFTDFCKKYPHLCQRIDINKIRPISDDDSIQDFEINAVIDEMELLEAINSFLADGTQSNIKSTEKAKADSDCGCGCKD